MPQFHDDGSFVHQVNNIHAPDSLHGTQQQLKSPNVVYWSTMMRRQRPTFTSAELELQLQQVR